MSRRRAKAKIPTQLMTWQMKDGHEPSAWLRSAVAARLIALEQRGDVLRLGMSWVVSPLSGLVTKVGSVEDFTCDRCRRYVDPDSDESLHLFSVPCKSQVQGVSNVLLSSGLCDECARKEGLP